ncbi:glycerol kinase 2 isoform X2 [Arctopsyche grandis]|uniref:glycerol kinase 2 isoform X2 n=1 Tax=Arctopsyche grandis TaxID=121162 RepID=UPI00406D82AC
MMILPHSMVHGRYYRRMPSQDSNRTLIAVIDEGTTSVKFKIYKSQCCQEIVSAEEDIPQVFIREYWVEQDPRVILNTVRRVAREAIKKLAELGHTKQDIVGIGITNQRETIVCWDKTTGEPLYNAIAWNDTRAAMIVDRTVSRMTLRSREAAQRASGLPVSEYFSALKMRWMLENVRSVRRSTREGTSTFGTIDTWLIWNLTGGAKNGAYVTDVTNASRTLLMNIKTLKWDPTLLRLFEIDINMLPEIKSSSEHFGTVCDGSALDGIPITGVLGNQQSALLGHLCLQPGQAKNTYRSGCFLLCNTGTKVVQSSHGLVTTVAYKLGKDAPAFYALEGSIAVAGSGLKWMKEKLRLLKDVATEAEAAARSVPTTADVYFVPALSGLLAPYWRPDARGILCGLTAFTTKNHIIRAAYESVCFQTKDIIEAMDKDCGFPLTKLRVDGKMTNSDLLLELQADISGIPVGRSGDVDVTALGVAMAAGQACGVWDIKATVQQASKQSFLPTTTEEGRNIRYSKWKMAVERSMGWCVVGKSLTMTDEKYRLLSSIPCSLYLVSTFIILIASDYLNSR